MYAVPIKAARFVALTSERAGGAEVGLAAQKAGRDARRAIGPRIRTAFRLHSGARDVLQPVRWALPGIIEGLQRSKELA